MKQPKYSKKLESINIDMTEYRTMLTKKFKARKPYEKNNPKKLKAFIPGTIRRIYVEKDQKVSKGDRLLVLEAMKMRNYIRAPFDGVIKDIYVDISSVVHKEKLLIEFK
ncbi:MAG: acetyl-CoA carboxylase biotin carboxyl carrier protein subunit [Bacteroidota bacterium]